MRWLSDWLRRFRASTAAYPARWFTEFVVGGTGSDSGVAVNGRTVLAYAPVWYAVNKIAGHVGQLPVEHRQWVTERESKKIDSMGAWLINFQPSEVMPPSIFRETLTAHALLWGNGRALIRRNNRREPIELMVLLPDRCETISRDNRKVHVYREMNGTKTEYSDNEILHIAGLGYDGIQGYSLIEIARNSFGMGMAAEKHLNKHFRNNAVPSMVLEAPPGVFRDQQDATAFLSKWNEYHSGTDNSGKAGLLREGIKANMLGVSGRDAQWLEERVFQRQEAALWFLLEQILGDNSSVSYNSLEQKNMAYVTNCLMRWLVKWEEELSRKLQTRAQFESQKYYWKFRTAALMRGTTVERYQVYQIARQSEILSANEIRALEDMPPQDPADDYANPATRSQPSGSVSPPPEEESDDDLDQPAANVARRAVRARLDGFAKIEQTRIEEATSKHSRRFTTWLDDFYVTGDFRSRIVDAVTSTGGSLGDADEWVRVSRESLLACAGRATYETLSAEVGRELQAWPERVTALADDIVRRQICQRN